MGVPDSSTLNPIAKPPHETCCLAGPQIERDEQLRTFQAYTNRFRSPYEQSYSTNPLYYSLDVGPIHVIMLNAVRTTSLPLLCAGLVCVKSIILGNIFR